MVFIRERIGKLVEDIKELVYPESVDISNYKMVQTTERFTDIANLNTDSWQDFSRKEVWGGHREYFWFETTITIPDSFQDKCVVYELLTGREGEWDATNPQFTIYVNGKLKQGLDVNHRETVLTEKATAGETYRIVLSAFTGDKNFSLKMDSKIKVLDRLTEKYYYDIVVPYKAALLLHSEDKAYITIISKLNESLNLLDLRQEYSKEYYASLEKASAYLTEEFYEKECGNSEAVMYCVGHTHIDVAWLWTLAVTEDKAVRSFSTVLDLMEQYPEYIFMSSQPQLYKYVKKNAPEVYERIKERVAEGRWEPEGGMFVEADCNIASGEALVRQFMYGQRFFKEEFEKDNSILWLPDVFGYSAALPQIMRKCGLPYFMTTKISWNEFNKMPYDTFEWEGIDGSRVLTHFVPTRDYKKGAVEGGFETEHFTTYNGDINPSQVKGGWTRYSQKHLNKEVLNSFGYGDGGGGATAEMLENQRRLEKGIPGMPRTKMSTAKDFFTNLEKQVKDHKYLPSWVGELYLEYHRGTYTSMARNKKYNRRAEFAYQNAELFSMMEHTLAGGSYPQTEFEEAWEVILRNQFHDILPGSSIKEVYEDSKEEYEKILGENHTLVANTLGHLTEKINAPKHSLVVYNPNGLDADEIVSFTLPSEALSHIAVYDNGQMIPSQKTAKGEIIFKADAVPSKGYKTFYLEEENTDESSQMTADTSHLENKFFDIRLNEKGQFISVFDKRANREVLKKGEAANVIMTYEDRPHNYDAWDLNNYYVEKSWEVDNVASIEVIENGPVRACLKIERSYLDSTIVQFIYIYQEIPRIDIKHEIDWKEHQIFMKALFPVDIHTNEASFDIQYGNVTRQTHHNTSWDFAKFEVCVHKWLDVSEDGYGVSMLNDCKYGCSVHDGVIGLSMLKSARYPNPDADKEFHEFTYSFYPHQGGFRQAGTIKQAYQLNNPLTAVLKDNEGGTLKDCYSYVSSNQDNVIVEVVKKAEKEEDLIVRLYECHNRRTETILTFGGEIVEANECDMMEQDGISIDYSGNEIRFEIKPYEIKTFKIKLK